jgi:enoyl-CoA hydratase/carnithine racemase
MEAAAADDNVRVIVLTGAGRAFCAGADMDALKGLDPDDIKRAQSLPAFDMNRRPDWQSRYGYYPSIAKPVIGMLNGATAGIGLVHALYCDLRFAADNTVLHHRVLAPRLDRRARHQLDAAAYRPATPCAGSA